MNVGAQLIAKQSAPPPATVQGWFDAALDRDDPKPSEQAYYQLSRNIQIVANRHNNAAIEKEITASGAALPISPPDGMIDVSPVEWRQKKISYVALQASQVLSAIQDLRHALSLLEEFEGEYSWNSSLNMTDLRESIMAVLPGLYGVGGHAPDWKIDEKSLKGRPKSAWHEAGRSVAIIIGTTLSEAGYDRKTSLKSEESAVTIISAAAVNWMFGLSIEPSGFASAMRSRRRGSLSE